MDTIFIIIIILHMFGLDVSENLLISSLLLVWNMCNFFIFLFLKLKDRGF